MDEVRDFIRNRGIEVLSIHAPQGNLLLDGGTEIDVPPPDDKWRHEPSKWSFQ